MFPGLLRYPRPIVQERRLDKRAIITTHRPDQHTSWLRRILAVARIVEASEWRKYYDTTEEETVFLFDAGRGFIYFDKTTYLVDLSERNDGKLGIAFNRITQANETGTLAGLGF